MKETTKVVSEPQPPNRRRPFTKRRVTPPTPSPTPSALEPAPVAQDVVSVRHAAQAGGGAGVWWFAGSGVVCMGAAALVRRCRDRVDLEKRVRGYGPVRTTAWAGRRL